MVFSVAVRPSLAIRALDLGFEDGFHLPASKTAGQRGASLV